MGINMKKILRISIIAVLVILAVLTFVSRTMYNRRLPRVSTVAVLTGFVPLFEDVESGMHVDEVLVTEGDEVQEGQALLTFDTWGHDFNVRTMELQILRLEYNLESGDALAAGELALAQDRLQLLRDNAPPTVLTAPKAGHIAGILAGPGQPAWVRIEERGEIQANLVPREAVFYTGNGNYAVYAISTRRGLFGPEDYVIAIRVYILRDNGVLASIHASEDGEEENRLEGLVLAHNIEGWVQNGDTVWVRER